MWPRWKAATTRLLALVLPGPVDTWNEIVFEIIKREYEGDRIS
jgi:hypothetical protein